LIGFFTLVYPLSGLLPTQLTRNSFDGIVQFFLIVYLFGVALHVRSQRDENIKNDSSIEPIAS